jgi:hypothetical protein
LGPDVKNGLMIGSRTRITSGAESLFGHRYRKGTTSTGIGSAFAEFHYFGCLIFMLIGYVMGRLYRVANSGVVWSQILYLVLLPITLLSMTHGHELFFTNIPLFLGVIALSSWISKHHFNFGNWRSSQPPGRLRT